MLYEIGENSVYVIEEQSKLFFPAYYNIEEFMDMAQYAVNVFTKYSMACLNT